MTRVENVALGTAVPARSPLGQIIGSKAPVTLLLAASGFVVLADVLSGLSHALLNTASLSTSNNLLTAGAWLGFVANAGGLAAICAVGWRLILDQDWRGVAEFAPVVVSSLLVAIGYLVAASALPNNPSGFHAGRIVAAIGFGGLMLLALVNAGRRSIQEQKAPVDRQSDLWLAATAGLLVLAVATALPPVTEPAKAIAENVVFGVPWVVLATTIHVARKRSYIDGRVGTTLVAGLFVLAAGYVVGAVASGFAFSPSASATTYRVGLSLPDFVQAVGAAVVVFAAFLRLVQLNVGPGVGPAGSPQGRYRSGPTADPTAPSRPSQETKGQPQGQGIESTTQSPAAPPGYYPDINGQHRYWDGQQWTEHTR